MKYDFPLIFHYALEKIMRAPLMMMRRIRSVFICWRWGIVHHGNPLFVGPAFIRTTKCGQIQFGNSVRFYSSKQVNPLCNGATTIDARDGSVLIGSRTGLSSVTISSRNSISIGEHCLIGANTQIYDHNFHALKAEDRRNPIKRNQVKTAPVVIEDECFIGANCILLKGTHVGKGSLIAAGSVVFGLDIPPHSLVRGNPAVIVENKR